MPTPQNSNLIQGYRQGETQPKTLQVNQIIDAARALNYVKGMTPAQLTDRILLEGRGDAGVNEFNVNNKTAATLYNTLISSGVDPQTATTAAAITDKQMVASRLGISFDKAWNGTGNQGYRSGDQYAARAQQFQDVSQDPKNAALLDLVTRASTGQLTPQEKLTKTLVDGNFSNIVQSVYGTINTDNPIADSTMWSMAKGTQASPNADPLTQTILDGLKKASPDPNDMVSINASKTTGKSPTEGDIVSILAQKTASAMGVNLTTQNADRTADMLSANPILSKVLDTMTSGITSYLNKGSN